MRSGRTRLLCGLVTMALVLAAAAPALCVAPVGKHYVTALLFFDPVTQDASSQLVCLSFTEGEVCTENDTCGPFEFIDRLRARNLWKASLETIDGDTIVEFEGHGMTERRGRGTSIGGTALLTQDGVTINASFAGIQAPLPDCIEVAAADD